MSIASFLEKTVIGDKNIKRDALDMGAAGAAEYARGTGIADEGLNGIRSGIDDIQGTLASGRYLPSSVNRAYDLTRGRIADETTRSIDAGAAGIAQRRLASGNHLSASAAEEYQSMDERDARDREFGSMVNVDQEQAAAELAQYNTLFDRLDSLRGTILNSGQFLEQLGQQQKVQGLLTRVDRAKAISSAGTSTGGAVIAHG